MLLPDRLTKQFLAEHRLPESFRSLIREHYLPLAEWVYRRLGDKSTPLLGINGAQGTGKSTLADFLRLALASLYRWNVVIVSIDDFYLTKSERNVLASNVHPLLATRGVPGTHDVTMLQDTIRRLRELRAGESLGVPHFDKAVDDRADESEWTKITGPVNLIIFEGWCVGSLAEPDEALLTPVNSLERDEDSAAIWRKYANDALRNTYTPLFRQLDALIFLQTPDFQHVYKWRLLQERRLAETAPADSPGIMNAKEITRFIQYYERITRNNLDQLPKIADVIFELDDKQHIANSRYTDPTR